MYSNTQQWFDRHLPLLRDVACWFAILVLPWQARWIIAYHELAGQRYEYGTVSLYAGSVIVILAVFLFYARSGQRIFADGKWRTPGKILAAWLLVGTLAAYDASLAFAYLVLAVIAFGYFVIVSSWEFRKTVMALIISGLIQTTIAWQQFIGQFIAENTILGVATHSPHVLGQSVVIIFGNRILRAYGLLPHPNMLGAFLAVVLVVLTYRFIMYERADALLTQRRERVRYVTAVLLLFSGVLITFSRAALIAVTLAFFGWCFYAWYTRRWAQVRALAYLGATCALLFLVFNMMTGGAWLQRLGIPVASHDTAYEQQRLDDRSADERIRAYYEALVLWSPRTAIAGVGLGNYVPLIAQAFPSLPSYGYQPVHNAYVMAVLEMGLIGVALFFWLLVSILRGSYRHHDRDVHLLYPMTPFLILLCIALFDHFLWTSYFGQSLWWLSVGLAVRARS